MNHSLKKHVVSIQVSGFDCAGATVLAFVIHHTKMNFVELCCSLSESVRWNAICCAHALSWAKSVQKRSVHDMSVWINFIQFFLQFFFSVNLKLFHENWTNFDKKNENLSKKNTLINLLNWNRQRNDESIAAIRFLLLASTRKHTSKYSKFKMMKIDRCRINRSMEFVMTTVPFPIGCVLSTYLHAFPFVWAIVPVTDVSCVNAKKIFVHSSTFYCIYNIQIDL